MKTIKDVIEESTILSEKLRAENTGMTSISFEFTGFQLDEMEAYAKENKEEVQFHPEISQFGFLAMPNSSTFIHIRSVAVKARLTQPV